MVPLSLIIHSNHSILSLESFFKYGIQLMIATAVVYFLLIKRYKQRRANKSLRYTDEEKDEIISKWKPEPLVPIESEENLGEAMLHRLPKFSSIEGKAGKYIQLDNLIYLNLSTTNFLGFVGDTRIEEAAKKTIFKYGVGSCGPRSFYGTMDVHLELERQLATFMHCEDAILYSYGFATIASAIPSYSKRGDIIFADKGVNFPIQKGIQASRSKVEWFEHNNMDELEMLLMENKKWSKKNPMIAAKTRLFIIVEGLYAKTADLCPLPKLLELKWKYKVRIFLDESLSFGVVGKTGRGITEYFGVNVVDIDMIMVSLENAMATTGGFCVGRKFLIESQRLASVGYVFSASLPPLLAAAASKALDIIIEEPNRVERLQQNARAIHKALTKACEGTFFEVLGFDCSPLKHIAIKVADEKSNCNIGSGNLDMLVQRLFDDGILVTQARYLDQQEVFPTRQSVKVACSSEMTEVEVSLATQKLSETIQQIHDGLKE